MTYGVLEERRLQLPDGLVIEVGITTPTWAAIEPLDEGTETVVRDGMQPLFDPMGLLSRLAENAVSE